MIFQNTPTPKTFESASNHPPIADDRNWKIDKSIKPKINKPLGSGNGIWQPQVPIANTVPSQVGGTHYADKKIQPIDAMIEWMSPEEIEGFYRGNVIKYIARYKDKNGLEDLEKCKDYLNRLIEFLKETK